MQAGVVAVSVVISRPVTANRHYPDKQAQSFIAPLIDDPRIAGAMARWDAEKRKQRRDVARFLAEFGDSG